MIGEQHSRIGIRARGVDIGQAEALLQQLRIGFLVGGHDPHGDPVAAALEVGQQRVQPALHQRRHPRDGQLLDLALGGQVFLRLHQPAEALHDQLVVFPPRRGQRGAPAFLDDQQQPRVIFQQPQLLADRAGGDAKRPRGGCDRAQPAERLECLQGAQGRQGAGHRGSPLGQRIVSLGLGKLSHRSTNLICRTPRPRPSIRLDIRTDRVNVAAGRILRPQQGEHP